MVHIPVSAEKIPSQKQNNQAGPDDVDKVLPAVSYRTNVMDNLLHYQATALFTSMHKLLEFSQLYKFESEKLDEWLKMIKCSYDEATLPQMF